MLKSEASGGEVRCFVETPDSKVNKRQTIHASQALVGAVINGWQDIEQRRREWRTWPLCL